MTLLRRPTEEHGAEAEVVTVSDVEADAAVRAHLRAVLDDIRELPERQRSALVMRELSGLSYDEIGTALETSEAGAKQAVYDARQALHVLAQGRDSDCDTIRRKLSDGDRRSFRGRVVRAHLTACADCRSWQAELAARETSWAAFAPTMPAAAAAALHSTLGGGAGAAAAGGVAATASGPAVATMVVAVVLGAGAVGVHELNKDGDGEGTPGAISAQAAPSTPRLAGSVSDHTRKAGVRARAVRRGQRDGSGSRADRARDRRSGGERGRGATVGRSGQKSEQREVGDGSTRLGSRPAAGPSTTAGGGSGRSGGLLGGRGRGSGGQSGEQGPIRNAVGDTRQAVQGTVNEVQEALPVPTPPIDVPTIRDPSPKRR